MKIWVVLLNMKTGKEFKKYFDTEFERDKFVRRSRYFTNIRVLSWGESYE